MNEFVWNDLSTYDPQKSKAFYQSVFGWQFHDAGRYFVAMLDSAEIAGLFETPDFFKKIKMPHFWMSYIAVEDAQATAAMASEFATAKVELTDEFYGGRIALIRDPQGAGFTVYDGGRFGCRKLQSGHPVWHELHVSDASCVIPFYERLFGWTIARSEQSGKFQVYNTDQTHVCDISVIPSELKGKYEYWVCTFAVDDLDQSKQTIIDNGGHVVYDEGERIMMCDNSHEAFFYIQSIG